MYQQKKTKKQTIKIHFKNGLDIFFGAASIPMSVLVVEARCNRQL